MKKALSILLVLILSVSAITPVIATAANGYAKDCEDSYIYLYDKKDDLVYKIWENGKTNPEITNASYDKATNTLTFTYKNMPWGTLLVNKMGEDFTIHTDEYIRLGAIEVTGGYWGAGLRFTGNGMVILNTEEYFKIPIKITADFSKGKVTFADTLQTIICSPEGKIVKITNSTYKYDKSIFTTGESTNYTVTKSSSEKEKPLIISGCTLKKGEKKQKYIKDGDKTFYARYLNKDDDYDLYKVIYIKELDSYVKTEYVGRYPVNDDGEYYVGKDKTYYTVKEFNQSKYFKICKGKSSGKQYAYLNSKSGDTDMMKIYNIVDYNGKNIMVYKETVKKNNSKYAPVTSESKTVYNYYVKTKKLLSGFEAPNSSPNFTVKQTYNGILIDIGGNVGTQSYNIYRKSEGAKKWTFLKNVKADNYGCCAKYTDTTAENGKTYSYAVSAKNYMGTGPHHTAGLSVTYKNIPSVTVKNANGFVSLKWDLINGAKGYTVYRKSESESKYKKIASVKTDTFFDSNVKSGKKYYYKVRSVFDKGCSDFCEAKTIIHLSTPAVSASNTKAGIKLNWNKITGAKGYVIYRKTGSGSYKKYKTVSDASVLSFTDKSVKSGTEYTYRVKAYNGTQKSDAKSISYIFLKPVEVTSATRTSKGIKIKWNGVSGAKGYYIYRKPGCGEYRKLDTVKDGSTVSYIDTSAQKDTTYSYLIKAYNGSCKGTYKNKATCTDKY